MPSASDEDRAKMAKYFGGSGIDDGPPMLYLHAKGWKFPRGGMILKPSPDYKPSQQEWDCVYFLCDEWDHAYEG
jgi:hypothetical protein